MGLPMDKETKLLPKFLLSGWLTALVTVGAIVATLVNLVITAHTSPLAERISILNEKVLAIDTKINDNDKDLKDWMVRIEKKIDTVLLEGK